MYTPHLKSAFEQRFRIWLLEDYHQRVHEETGWRTQRRKQVKAGLSERSALVEQLVAAYQEVAPAGDASLFSTHRTLVLRKTCIQVYQAAKLTEKGTMHESAFAPASPGRFPGGFR